MASGSRNTFPIDTPPEGASAPIKPGPYLPPIVRDYPVQTIVNSALPNPSILDKTNAASTRNLVLKTAKPGDAIPYCFGRTLVRPTVIGADDTGEYLVLDLMWSVGEVQRVCNGAIASSAPSGTWDYALKFPDIAGLQSISGGLYEHFRGTQTQAASSIMTALKGSYVAYPGIAHSVISMQLGWNLNVMGYCDGVKVIDPRVSPQLVWTENPALILADMLVRCGYTMDYTSVADAADYCDELVGSASPQIERWKISGVVYDRADLQSWIHTMAQYAHCFVDKSGSTFFLRPDKPRASSHAVTAADMLAGSPKVKLRGQRNTVEGVRVTYAFASRTLDAEYGTLTDPGTITQLPMPYWESSYPYLGAHAKRHAEEVYRKSQLEVEELEFISFDEGLNRTVGDVGTITNDSVGLSAKTMALIDNQQIEPGRWRRKYTEYSATVYQDTSYDITYNDTELYNPYSPPNGPTPTLDWEYNAASPQQPILTLSWVGITWAYLKDYKVVILSDDSPQITIYDSSLDGNDYVPNAGAGVTHTLDLSAYPVVFGTTYTAYVYVRSIVDALGEPGEDSIRIYTWDDSPITLWYPTSTGTATPELRFRTASTDGLGVSVARYTYVYFPNGNEWLEFEGIIGADYVAGEYLIKYEVVTLVEGNGNIEVNGAPGVAGTWYDAYGRNFTIYDVASPSTKEHIILDFTLARDAGDGTPVINTQKTKQVTFIAYKGAYGYVVEDLFLGINGTDLTAHTPNTDTIGGGWINHEGVMEIQANRAVATASSPTADTRCVIDAGTADCCIMAEYGNLGSGGTEDPQDFGLIGRAQDASNYWSLMVTGANTANPVLELAKIVAGVRTVMNSVTMTGEGPFGAISDRPIRLMCDGNNLYGYTKNEHSLNRYEVAYESTIFNTETVFGLHSTGTATTWDEVHITTAEIGLIT